MGDLRTGGHRNEKSPARIRFKQRILEIDEVKNLRRRTAVPNAKNITKSP